MEDLVFGRRYRVTEQIGTGGMADVYKAVDETLGRTVAVKVLHAQYAREENFVARFRQEAQAAANLSHPSVVNIYDWGKDGDTYYIVMEYVRGTDLKSLVQQRGPVDPIKAAEYAVQVCSALAVAHGYDVIHRDIKPHNLVLMPDGTVKVTDFGIARAGNSTMTQTGSVLGTAHYISPEQAQGRPLTPASDLYSLGVTLYELTTGRLPFEGDTPVSVALKQVNEEPAPPRRIRPEIPAALENVILKAMQKDPAARYHSAEEMREDLRKVVLGEPVAAPAAVAAGRIDDTAVISAVEREERLADVRRRRTPPPRRNVTPWLWVGLAVLLLLAGLLAAAQLGLFSPPTVEVPDVQLKTEAEASRILSGAGLEVGDVTTENSDQVDKGLVISQTPEPGRRAERGSAVNLVVSLGVAEVEVPDLSGMTQNEALEALRGAGLDIGSVDSTASADVPSGQVVSQEPAGGTSVPKDTQVRILLSTGPLRSVIPDVVGKPVREARGILQAAGFKVEVTERNDPTGAGKVIDQRPGAGGEAAAGTLVTIVVSKGPETVKVPNVVGLNETQARGQLEAAGLQVRVTPQDDPDPANEGLVVLQTPARNSQVLKGATVEIFVGRTPMSP